MFRKITDAVSSYVGSPYAITAAVCAIILWGLSGFIIGFSDTWQLIINTSTTIITFLMTFLIQATQNRDNKAIHAKLDDIIYHLKGVDNKFIGAEKLDEKDIERLRSHIKE